MPKKPRPYSTAYQAADAETAKRYLLSGIPPGLWRAFQARCKREGIAMRQVLLGAVQEWTARPSEASPGCGSAPRRSAAARARARAPRPRE